MPQIIEFIQTHLLLCALWVVLLAAVIYSFIVPLLSGVKGIAYQQVTQLINKRDAVIVDVRSGDQYRKGHIAGSVNLTQSKVTVDDLKAYEKYREQPIVVACELGNKASVVARVFSKAGFKEVYFMQGGINAWNSANLPLVKK
ncbi:rhodanese-like domain-containing protein [Celerinatantimonas sp. YJH-8]|uniref:rhodanese-like domain-containing protein n=1 Tax=Celerinatantimonas sp. YJH-8 TaxID=3228714 RepID=UPI0038C7BEA9